MNLNGSVDGTWSFGVCTGERLLGNGIKFYI